MIYEIWIATVLIAFLTRSSKAIHLPEFNRPLWLIAPFLVQLAAMSIHSYLSQSVFLFLSLVNFSYLLLIFALWQNRHIPGFRIFLIGTIANALVIWFNNGRMPVSLEAIHFAGLESYIPALVRGVTKHQLMDDHTVLWFLGDIIPFSRPYAEHSILSIGDVFQSSGIALLIWKLIRGYNFRV
jgi:hypothetical protein